MARRRQNPLDGPFETPLRPLDDRPGASSCTSWPEPRPPRSTFHISEPRIEMWFSAVVSSAPKHGQVLAPSRPVVRAEKGRHYARQSSQPSSAPQPARHRCRPDPARRLRPDRAARARGPRRRPRPSPLHPPPAAAAPAPAPRRRPRPSRPRARPRSPAPAAPCASARSATTSAWTATTSASTQGTHLGASSTA